LFLLLTIVVVTVVITVFVALFLYYTFKIYSAIRLSSRKCVIQSVRTISCVTFYLSYPTSYEKVLKKANTEEEIIINY